MKFKNYMSYCGGRNLFTQGQKDRSRNIIMTTTRKQLLKSRACTVWCDTAFTQLNAQTCDPLAATIHYDTLSTVKGCDSIIITHTTLIVPPPLADFSFTPGSGNSIIFDNHSTNSASYFWNFGDDSTSTEVNPTHTYLVGSNYEVELIATNSCSSDTAHATVTLISTGLGNANHLQSILLYPNPNKGVFTLKMEVTGTNTYIEIVNELGQIVAQQLLATGKHHTISLAGKLSKGMYRVDIRKNGQSLGNASIIIF